MVADNRNTPFSEADGRQLAFSMMRELNDWINAADASEAAKIGDSAEPNMREFLLNQSPEVMQRYLTAVAEAKCPDLQRGFLAVLSFEIAKAADNLLDDVADEYIEPRPGLLFKN